MRFTTNNGQGNEKEIIRVESKNTFINNKKNEFQREMDIRGKNDSAK